ncbi:TM2 domain-containing protein [bacterium 1xD8-48]|jgi:TM2 domain-containing membrane protein YozV|nr:TM2 domain-containing protein [Lachnospiraceae bacterium]MCI9325886.1 TM2 domain-containing protein [Lachnospiraceae bacterium]NBJ98258.1 TM2 domain-containing protein [bacterium 1xD8-48]
MKLKTDKKKDEKVNFDDYLALQKELDETRQKYGVEVKEGKVSRAISNFFDKREARELHSVSRKKYLIIALLTGWMGGHRFYARQYPSAVLYLLLFWTGFPFAMTLIDLMIAIPKEPDENGNILM